MDSRSLKSQNLVSAIVEIIAKGKNHRIDNCVIRERGQRFRTESAKSANFT